MFRKVFRIVFLGVVALAATVAAPAATLQPGATAPNFTLPSQESTPVSLSDYHGKWVVLYFYPKDMSPGCSLEAHNFQRDQAKYEAANAVILGVNLDSVKSHQAFCTKDSLHFKLLADPDRKVLEAYGVSVMYTPIGRLAHRETFLISPNGKIVKSWDVKDIRGHSDEVLAAIAAEKK
jgi:peroxiredoxin Q/BCP